MTEVETEQDQDDMSVEGRKERPERPSVGLSNISSQGCSRVFVIKSTNSQIYSIFHFYLLTFFTNTDIYIIQISIRIHIVLLIISQFVRGKQLPSIFTFDKDILNKWIDDARVIITTL